MYVCVCAFEVKVEPHLFASKARLTQRQLNSR